MKKEKDKKILYLTKDHIQLSGNILRFKIDDHIYTLAHARFDDFPKNDTFPLLKIVFTRYDMKDKLMKSLIYDEVFIDNISVTDNLKFIFTIGVHAYVGTSFNFESYTNTGDNRFMFALDFYNQIKQHYFE